MAQRRQLTLFASPNDTKVIEAVRQKYNPIQFGLIRSHVTLCREEEIEDLANIVGILQQLRFPKLGIYFGPVTTFSDGQGVWLPDNGKNETFHELRSRILGEKEIDTHRVQPHLTLMHPLNSTCNPTLFQEISSYPLPTELTFAEVSLIEQTGGQAWKILQSFPLVAAN